MTTTPSPGSQPPARRTRVVDVSWPVHSAMAVWPDTQGPSVEQVHAIADGAAANVTRWTLDAHHGTHVDAPKHNDDAGAGVDQLALETLVGRCEVVDLAPTGQRAIRREDLASRLSRRPDRVLLKTVNSDRQQESGPYDPAYAALTDDAAAYLVEQGVRLVGVDALSVDAFDAEDRPVHRRLFAADTVILEGLRLAHVAAGAYTLCCLPVPLRGSDGAPARTVLLPP